MATVDKKNKAYGWTYLDVLVREALHADGYGLERYELYLQHAKDIYKMWKMDMSREVKTVEIELTSWKAIEWPDDFVDWTLIGLRRNGRLYVFSNDNEIPLYFDRTTDNDPLPNTETFDDIGDLQLDESRAFNFRNFNGFGEDAGRLTGLSVKNNGVGYFRINKERREIQLNPIMEVETAYLEYLASANNPCQKTIVPEYAHQLIKDGITWRARKHSKNTPRSHVKEAKDDFWQEWSRVQQRTDDTTIADIVEAALDGYGSFPHN